MIENCVEMHTEVVVCGCLQTGFGGRKAGCESRFAEDGPLGPQVTRLISGAPGNNSPHPGGMQVPSSAPACLSVPKIVEDTSTPPAKSTAPGWACFLVFQLGKKRAGSPFYQKYKSRRA